MDETRRANLSHSHSRFVSHNIVASSRYTRDSKVNRDTQKVDKHLQAESVKGPEAHHALPQNVGLAPIAIGASIVGFVLLLIYILSIVSWGFGNGCLAQC